MCKLINNLLTLIINKVFKLNSETNLRQISQFFRYLIRSVYHGKKSIPCISPKIWDILPDDYKTIKNLNTVQIKIKQTSLTGPPVENLISAPIQATKFFLEVSALLDVRHCLKLQSCAISRKTNDVNLRKSQKFNFGPNFGPPKFFSLLLPLLDVRHCRKLSSYAISRKIYDPNSRKQRKTLFWAWIQACWPKFGSPNFFFKNLASSVTRYHGQLSSCTISEKTNDLILRKFSDGRADRHTDDNDFIGHCPTNVERPKIETRKLSVQVI